MLWSSSSAVFSRLIFHGQKQTTGGAPAVAPRREFHVEPGLREKALLAHHPALKRFKSPRKSVKRLKRVGDVLTIAVVAGCCYEIYVRAVMREEARGRAREGAYN